MNLDYLTDDDAAEFAGPRANISKLESAASGKVKTAWSVHGDLYDRFTGIMDDADLSIDEVLYWDDNGELPASVDQKQFAPFFRKMKALDYAKVDEACNTIAAHAETECGIDPNAE